MSGLTDKFEVGEKYQHHVWGRLYICKFKTPTGILVEDELGAFHYYESSNLLRSFKLYREPRKLTRWMVVMETSWGELETETYCVKPGFKIHDTRNGGRKVLDIKEIRWTEKING